jgi:hypothetical protein
VFLFLENERNLAKGFYYGEMGKEGITTGK